MLDLARKKALQKGPPFPVFIEGGADAMPFDDHYFDAIIIGFGFRNLTFEHPQSERHLAEIIRVLKPGGQLIILESTPPKNAVSHALFRLYLRAVLIPLGTLLSGHRKAYQYLARSSEGFYNACELSDMLVSHGLHPADTHTFLLGSVSLITVDR
jgi:demethylmenaquinone methyltransferase/2-methoxy-6-polyprenyl-1,4-benzoquinol methylase